MARMGSVRSNPAYEPIRILRIVLWIIFLLGLAGFLFPILLPEFLGARQPPMSWQFPTILVAMAAGAGLQFTWARASGARGERMALKRVARLPDTYRVFNNVLVPSSRGRPRELDCVVVGPNGIFVIEVKANKGEIEGGTNDAQWRARKVGRGGTVYYTRFGNPIRQVRGATAALAEYLRGRGIKTWVQSIVCFTHSRAPLNYYGAPDVIVTWHDTLSTTILRWQPKRPPGDQAPAEEAIADLLSPTWTRRAQRARGMGW